MRMNLWILIFVILFGNENAFAVRYIDGADSSGGGLAVVCRYPDETLKSVQMLDLFDAQIYGLTIVNPGLSTEGLLNRSEQTLKMIFQDVKDKKSPDKLIAKALNDFSLLPIDVKLAPVNDGNPAILPKFCIIEQAALYKNNKILLVDQELWNFMDDLNKAALIVHEAVYLHERELGDKTSERSRKIVAHLFSKYPFEPIVTDIPKDANECIAYPQNNLSEISFEFYKYRDPKDANQEVLQFTKFRGRFPYSITRVYTPLWPWKQGDFLKNLDVDSPIELFDQISLEQNKVLEEYLIAEISGDHIIKCSKPLVARAKLEISDGPTFDFGTGASGASLTHFFTVSNTGKQTATSLSGYGLSAPFSFVGGSYPGTAGTCGAKLSVGSTCSLHVSFVPKAGQAADTILIDYHDGIATATSSRDIRGTGTSPALLSISDGPTYDFGLQAIGSSHQQTFTLTNSGGYQAANIAEAGLSSPFVFHGGSFPGLGGTCATTLNASATCTLVISYSPYAGGAHSDSMVINYNNGGSTQTATRAISGTAAFPALITITDTDPYDFGNVTTGSSASRVFTITNTGAVNATAMHASGLAAPYSFFGGSYPGTGGTCGTILVAASSCTVVLKFSPTVSGVHNDTLDINYNDGVSAQTSSRQLTGTSFSPALLSIDSGPTYDFGLIANGGLLSKVFTITNNGGTAASNMIEVGLSAPFGLKGGIYPGTGGTCGSSLAATASCIIVVEFAPAGLGSISDTIKISYNNGAMTANTTRDVQGTGGAPARLIISNGPTYNYGTQAVGSSTNFTFTVTNSGSVTATSLSSHSLVDPFSFNGGSYPGTGGTCGATLVAGASCSIVIRFAPTSSGVFNDTLELNHFDGASSQLATRDITGAGVISAAITDL